MAGNKVDFTRSNAITFKIPKNKLAIPTDGGNIEIQIQGIPGDVFSLTLEDSDGCNILLNSPIKGTTLQNVTLPKTGVFDFTVNFPACGSSSRYFVFKDGEHEVKKIFQYPLSNITFTKSSNSSSSTNPQTLTLAGSDITSTGQIFKGSSAAPVTAKVWNNKLQMYERQVVTRAGLKDISWTATVAGGFDGKLYISRQPKDSDISISTSYTKTTAKKVVNSTNIEFTQGTTNLKEGMILSKVDPIIKTMIKQPFATSCYDSTRIFELSDTKNLRKGMEISCSYTNGFYISSIDHGNKRITTNVNKYIRDNTELTFSYVCGDTIKNVDDHHRITVGRKMNIPKNTDLTFSIDDGSLVTFDITEVTGSGSDTITMTGKAGAELFGDRDVTYTLNVDNFITNTPSAYDISVEVTKNTPKAINMTLSDTDSDAASKVGTVTSGPSHGSVGAYDAAANTFTYTPYTGFTGEDKFTFTITESSGDFVSAEKAVSITVK